MLVADNIGEIAHLVLSVPSYEAKDFATQYLALLQQLPAQTEVTLVVATEARTQVEAWFNDCPQLSLRRRLQIVTTDFSITPWARDCLVVDSQTVPLSVISSSSLARKEDHKIPHLLAEALQMQVRPLSAPFEGGNLLVGEQHVFVGADTLTEFAGQANELALKRFRSVLADELNEGREVVVIASTQAVPEQFSRTIELGDQEWQQIQHYLNKTGTRQPIFHIDVFLTFANVNAHGQQRVLVGDPRLADKLLNRQLPVDNLAAHFDDIAAQLAALGFEVLRNPLPLIYMDEADKRQRTWFYASSNNVLLQCGECEPIVWLPQFAHDHWPELKITDDFNRALWQDLGFEVRMIPGCQRLAENMGGLHCLSNVLKRH